MPPDYYLDENIIDTLVNDVTVTTSMNYIFLHLEILSSLIALHTTIPERF